MATLFILDLREMSRLQSSAMRFDRPTTKRVIQRHFAILFLLWWGGLNCLAGCLNAPTSVIGEGHCSMSDEGGDCCLTEAGGDESVSSRSIGTPSTSLQPLTCCSLESLSAVVNRNVRAADYATDSAILNRIEFTPESEPCSQLPDQRMRITDRGGTYLIHCVFLI